jgi:hypothetical protein
VPLTGVAVLISPALFTRTPSGRHVTASRVLGWLARLLDLIADDPGPVRDDEQFVLVEVVGVPDLVERERGTHGLWLADRRDDRI